MLDHIVDRHWRALRESRNQLRTGLTSSLRVMEERLARTRPDHLLAQVEARLRVTEDVIRAAHPSVHAAAVRITPASVSLQLVTSGAPVLRRDLERTVDGSDRTLKSLQPSVLGRAVSGLADRASTHLLGAAAELRALSPDATLRRGYAMPLSPAGRVLRQFGLTR